MKHQLMLNKDRSWVPCYLKSEADAVISDLQAKLEVADKASTNLVDKLADQRIQIAELESALKAGYNKVCFKNDADTEIRKAKRALWIARACRAHAEWAHWATIWFRDTDAILNINKARLSQSPYRCTTKRNAAIWRNMWHKVEHKCRVKAEEYEP